VSGEEGKKSLREEIVADFVPLVVISTENSVSSADYPTFY